MNQRIFVIWRNVMKIPSLKKFNYDRINLIAWRIVQYISIYYVESIEPQS